MNIAVKKLAIVLRDLMIFSESDIFIGRKGFRVNDFSSRQVTIDSTGAINVLSSSNKFDGTNEDMEYSQQISVPCIINFYGDAAYSDATNFSLLLKSQSAYELQRDNGIAIQNVGQLIDVKMLTGEQYNGRIQIDLNVILTISTSVDTLRIDTAQLDTDYPLWEA